MLFRYILFFFSILVGNAGSHTDSKKPTISIKSPTSLVSSFSPKASSSIIPAPLSSGSEEGELPSLTPEALSAADPSPFYARLYCFDEGPPTLPQVLDHDCFQITQDIADGDKADAPMLFSRHDGYTVPHRFVWGTCVIVIDMLADDDELRIPLTSIKWLAEKIVKDCIQTALREGSQRTGGKAEIGLNPENFLMGMEIVGKIKPKHEWPPESW
ncbi:hypothetical protein MMC06_006316 [Schaereria dolodes]|nr:hypothetical protein [Schaereria dolodes]